MYELVTSKDLQDPETGLLSAKPKWLTLDSISCRSSNADVVSPLSSFVDLQNAIQVVEKNVADKKGDETNEVSTVPSSSMTSSSECSL